MPTHTPIFSYLKQHLLFSLIMQILAMLHSLLQLYIPIPQCWLFFYATTVNFQQHIENHIFFLKSYTTYMLCLCEVMPLSYLQPNVSFLKVEEGFKLFWGLSVPIQKMGMRKLLVSSSICVIYTLLGLIIIFSLQSPSLPCNFAEPSCCGRGILPCVLITFANKMRFTGCWF